MMKIRIAFAALAFASAASLHAQVQTIKKLPPATGAVATLNLPAPTKEGEVRPISETVDSKIAAATGLPDLIVREIRHEGDGKFGIRVANQGTLRAGTFTMMLELFGPTGSTQRTIVDVPALDGNGEYWVTAELMEPSKIVRMQAIADVSYVRSNIKADPATGLPLGGTSTWSIVPSKVKESNETNNTLSVDVPPA